MIKISFCIPTYNFGKFIGETLQSIVDQASDEIEIEIVIGDGASTDNTRDIVRKFQDKFSFIHYYKFNNKGGIDKDLARTVELSNGEYCWLLSADDVLMPGSINAMLKYISSSNSIYLVNRVECDTSLNQIYTKSWLLDTQLDREFDFSVSEELKEYLYLATGLGSIFSFMSSIIVSKTEWNSIKIDDTFIGTNYSHVFRLFDIALSGGRIKYIKKPMIYARLFNDSFMSNGIGKRFLIDLDGYKLVIYKFFDKMEAGNLIKSIMRKEHTWYQLLSLRSRVTHKEWSDLHQRFIFYRYGAIKLILIKFLGSKVKLVQLARRVKKIFYKKA